MSLTTRLSARIAHRATPAVPSPLRIVQNATPITKHRESTPAKGTSTKGSPRKARKTSQSKAEQIVEKLSKVRKCIGCKDELDSHLFLALHPKSDQDFKEKCFKCRRVDAVSDFLKAHNKNANGTANLTTALQQDHIENQKEACQKWKRVMASRGVDIGDDVVASVMEAVMKHPALLQATKMPTKKTDKTPANKASLSLPFHEHQTNITLKQPSAASTDLSKTAEAITTNNNNNNTTASNLANTATLAELPAVKAEPLLLITIDALQRAVNHLHKARHLPAHHFDNVVQSVFHREFEYRAVTGWANMLIETVELAVATQDQWKQIDQAELEAIRTLSRMRYDVQDDNQ